MLRLKSLHSVYSHKSEIILSHIFLNDGLHVFFVFFLYGFRVMKVCTPERRKKGRCTIICFRDCFVLIGLIII